MQTRPIAAPGAIREAKNQCRIKRYDLYGQMVTQIHLWITEPSRDLYYARNGVIIARP